MRYLWIFLLFISTAHAQTTSTLCSMIKDRHSIHYTPGINVHGKKVVSANLNDEFSKTLFPLKIPVEADLVERFGLNTGNGIELEPTIAHFQVHEDGRVMYGGKDLTDKAQNLCQPPKQESYNE